MPAPMQSAAHIDVSQIPPHQCRELAQGAIDLMEQVFSMPPLWLTSRLWREMRLPRKTRRRLRCSGDALSR